MTKRVFFFLLLAASPLLAQSATVTGNLQSLTGGNITSRTFVRFELAGCAGNQPRVNGTAILAPNGGPGFYADFSPNGSGIISGSLYANSEITCGTVTNGTWYNVTLWRDGRAGVTAPYNVAANATFNYNNATPLTTNPVVAAPTGDSTYLRLDGGNSPVTGMFGVSHVGSTQALQGGFSAVTPLSFYTQNNTSSAYFTSPDVFLSRVDTTPYDANACAGSFPLAACDAPILRISYRNTLTGNIAAPVGVECDMSGFKANGASPPLKSNFVVCFGAQVQDASVDNRTNLRALNPIVVVNGLPTGPGPNNVERSAAGAEWDINNSSGADATVGCGSAASGNCIFGNSFVSFGANHLSQAIAISSGSTAGKGWLYGVTAGGVANVGLEVYPQNSVTPTYGARISGASSVGLIVGCGSISDPLGCAIPTTGTIFDARGTSGVSENTDSTNLCFRDKVLGPATHDWCLVNSNGSGNALLLSFDGATKFTFTSGGLSSPTITSPTTTGTDSGTETLQNKALITAGSVGNSGNNVTQLNEQDVTGTLTGTGADANVFQYLMTKNTVGQGKCFIVRFGATNGNATATTYKIWVGATAVWTGTTAAATDNVWAEAVICNNAGVQNAQHSRALGFDAATAVGNVFASPAEDLGNTGATTTAIKATFNVANPNTVTGKFWSVELIQ